MLDKYSYQILVCLLIFGIASCGGDSTPSVSIENIADGATGVDVDHTFVVDFSSAVDQSSVTSQTLFLVESEEDTDTSSSNTLLSINTDVCDVEVAIDASVTCASNIECSLNPTDDLDYETSYSLCALPAITFLSGTFEGSQIDFTTETESGSSSDTTAPTVTITSSVADLTASSPFTVTITFSEVVTGFVIGDIDVTNGSASNLSETTSGTVFTASITPSSDPATVTVAIAADVASDAAGNANSAASSFSIRYDTSELTVALSDSVSDFTNTSPVTVTATFSEEVSGFALNDLNVTNGTAANLNSSSNPIFTFDVTPTAEGLVTVALSADKATDSLTGEKSNNAATSLTFTYDVSEPTVSSYSPADAATDIEIDTTISVTFDGAMSTSTVTTNTDDTNCDGSLQVSDDDFSTCIQMDAAPVASNNNETFTVTPQADLDKLTIYKVRVTTDVEDAAGNALASTETQATGFETVPDLFIWVTDNAVFSDMPDYPLAASGVAAADEYCNDETDANHPGNGATYKALIADSINRLGCTTANCTTGGNSEHIDWPLQASTTYARPDGTVIGTTDEFGLFTFPLDNAIAASGPVYAWTGMETDYTSDAAADCDEWTYEGGVGSTDVGDASLTSASAVGGTNTQCQVLAGTRHLICVEQ